MNHLTIDDFDINIDVDIITPSLLWESRFKQFEKYVNSQEIFNSMSDDEQQAIISRLKRAVGVMHDTIDEWIPDALSLSNDGSCLRIEFNLVMSNIEIDVERKHKATSFRLKEVRDEIESLLKEDDQ